MRFQLPRFCRYIAASAAVVLLSAIAVGWVRSFYVSDGINFHRFVYAPSDATRSEKVDGSAFTSRGRVWIEWMTWRWSPPASPDPAANAHPGTDWEVWHERPPSGWSRDSSTLGFSWEVERDDIPVRVGPPPDPDDLMAGGKDVRPVGYAHNRRHYLVIPNWILAVIFVGVPVGLVGWRHWRRVRRAAAGRCLACGYDLRGRPGGRCPECGTDPVRPRTSAAPTTSAA